MLWPPHTWFAARDKPSKATIARSIRKRLSDSLILLFRRRTGASPVAGVDKLHPALKHAGYSATAVLPGENRADFEKLHQDLLAEFNPVGAFEHGIVANMPRLLWRKSNLATFRMPMLVLQRVFQIWRKHDGLDDRGEESPGWLAALEEARKELGDTCDLIEIRDIATVHSLLADLKIEERLDAMIDKCLKRLLFVRGLKSLPAASSSAPPQPMPKPQLIPPPTEAA
jgi:hypothetical protein